MLVSLIRSKTVSGCGIVVLHTLRVRRIRVRFPASRQSFGAHRYGVL